MRVKGKISSWNDDKGFGFITPMNGGKRTFIHIKSFNNRSRRPAVGDIVTYKLSTDKQGRPCAIDANMAGDQPIKRPKANTNLFTQGAAAVFLIVVAFFAISSQIRIEILFLYLVASSMAFFMYFLDKSAATKGAWRTPENTLHLVSIVGGWPGAIFAQQTFRHKTKKTTFRAIFWVTVFLNCGAFLWMLSPTGKQFVNALI